MPITLYLNNFRGFFETFVDLADVNFLVGENSTGKTSFLSLFTLLSDARFWYYGEFNSSGVRLGNFADISNSNNKDASFQIGFLAHDMDRPTPFSADRRLHEAALLSFIAEDGEPLVKEFIYMAGEVEVALQMTENRRQLRYRIRDLSDEFARGSSLRIFFDKWREQIGRRLIGTTSTISLNDPDLAPHKAPMHLLYAVQNHYMQSPVKVRAGGAESPSVSYLRVMFPYIRWDTTSMAPIRAKPQRVYTDFSASFTPEGDHIPYLLRKLYASGKQAIPPETIDRLSKFGQLSGLFQKINVSQFGKKSMSPFELLITIDDTDYNISSVGYGVSQVLPLVIQALFDKDDEWFAIQQPEVHLHPKAQAAFGELLFDICLHDKKKLLVETHSDFVIDRFRLKMRRHHRSRATSEDETSPSAQVLFFERVNGKNKVHKIALSPSGEYPPDQPETFRTFFIEEELQLLGA